MNIIIKFELKKFIHNKKNIIIMVMFSVCVSFFLYLSNYADQSMLNAEINLIQQGIDSNEKITNDIKSRTENSDSKDINLLIEENEQMIIVLNNMIHHIQNNDRLSLLDDKIAYNNLTLVTLSHPGIVGGRDTTEIKEETDFLTHLKDLKLEEINELVSIKADNAIILLLGFPAIIIIIITVFMCADVISSEFDNKTSYILFSQPIKKSKIFFGKFINSTLLITLIFSLFFIILYSVLTIIKGGLQFNYPYTYYNGNNMSSIPAISFILLSFVLLFLIIFFVISLTFFVSSLFKNTLASASVTAVFIFLFYLLSSNGLFGGTAHLLPFSYFNIASVINGETSLLYNNTDIIFMNGVIVLTASILIFMLSGFIVFKNNTGNI